MLLCLPSRMFPHPLAAHAVSAALCVLCLCSRDNLEDITARRLLNELLMLLTEASRRDDWSRIVVVCATNREGDLDPALLRRLERKIHCPVPNAKQRARMLQQWMEPFDHALTQQDMLDVVAASEGWNGSDLRALCTQAAMRPLREAASAFYRQQVQLPDEDEEEEDEQEGAWAGGIASHAMQDNDAAPGQLRPILRRDFESAFRSVRPSESYGQSAAVPVPVQIAATARNNAARLVHSGNSTMTLPAVDGVDASGWTMQLQESTREDEDEDDESEEEEGESAAVAAARPSTGRLLQADVARRVPILSPLMQLRAGPSSLSPSSPPPPPRSVHSAAAAAVPSASASALAGYRYRDDETDDSRALEAWKTLVLGDVR